MSWNLIVLQRNITSCVPEAQVNSGALSYHICTEVVKHCWYIVLMIKQTFTTEKIITITTNEKIFRMRGKKKKKKKKNPRKWREKPRKQKDPQSNPEANMFRERINWIWLSKLGEHKSCKTQMQKHIK